MVRVRLAAWEEIPTAARVVCAAWKTAYRGLVPDADIAKYTDTERKTESLERLIRGGLNLFVAEENGEICGAGSFGADENDPKLAYLMQLYVAPEKQGGGIGTALLERICDEAAACGFSGVVLNTLEQNTKARRFYEKHGFVYAGAADSPIFSERVVCAFYRKVF
ncbi:MAG: GNAT family N-acetyltransferase [Oscillospiraceae bacterium]